MLFETIVFRKLEDISLGEFSTKLCFGHNVSLKEITASISIVDDNGNLMASFYKTENYAVSSQITSTKSSLARSLAAMAGQFYLHFKSWI